MESGAFSPKGATVGAPPDFFNQQGQNWSQPPLSPIDLENNGYRTYRDIVHGMFAQSGAVRIDHILGLFRLWWIPEGKSATEGAYVYYDSDIMLGILAIEASPRRPAWWSARTSAWCRSTWPIRWPNTGCWAAPSNGSSRPTACSMSPGPGVRTRWRR